MPLHPALRRRGALALLAFSPLLAACGSSSPHSIGPTSAGVLHRDVAQIRTAAALGDTGRAHAALAALRDDITRLAARGDLARADAGVLLVDANQIDARIAASAHARPAPVATPTTTAAPSPAPPPVPGKKPGNGRGPGHGHGGDGGGD